MYNPGPSTYADYYFNPRT